MLHAWPDSAWQPFNAALGAIPVDDGDVADERFNAWCSGRTGYPIVDAGMRQLSAEGFMHNRLRMTVASFLVKDLHLDWRRGARFFSRHLYDGDVASNNHGWQWVAGTGTDAAPYYRVFNPMRQGERFDPGGEYVRRWVPELAALDANAIHRPQHGRVDGYPEPIVDHTASARSRCVGTARRRGDAEPFNAFPGHAGRCGRPSLALGRSHRRTTPI